LVAKNSNEEEEADINDIVIQLAYDSRREVS